MELLSERYKITATEPGGSFRLSTHCSSGHFLQAWQGIVKEGFEGCTVVIVMFVRPIPLAAAPADGEVTAGSADFRTSDTFLDKTDADRGVKCFLYVNLHDVSNFPVIQDIEVAGIQTAVTFYHQIASAGPGCGAGAGRLPHQDPQVVIEGTDADIISGLPVPIPAVKQIAEEFAVSIRFQRIEFSTSFRVDGVQTGNELHGVPT